MVIDGLRAEGIQVAAKVGNHRVICPKCSHTRKKKGDRCLSVTVEHDGATWNCWHCGFTGGFKVDRERNQIRRNEGHQPGDFGTARRRLRYDVLSQAR